MAQAVAALTTPGPGSALPCHRGERGARSSLLGKRGRIGPAPNQPDGDQQLSSSRNVACQGRRSDIQDIDFASAATELSRRQAIFEAGINRYSSISRRSRFDFL